VTGVEEEEEEEEENFARKTSISSSQYSHEL